MDRLQRFERSKSNINRVTNYCWELRRTTWLLKLINYCEILGLLILVLIFLVKKIPTNYYFLEFIIIVIGEIIGLIPL